MRYLKIKAQFMKNYLLVLALFWGFSSFSQLIILKGSFAPEVIKDKIGQITIFSAVDSTLKKGGYIDSSVFEVPFSGKLEENYYAKIKLTGYTDTIINFNPTEKEVNLGLIQMQADRSLATVEVVYREPAFERTMDGVEVNVKGTTLEQLTNLFEILKASPRLNSPDDERIEIIGKGSPLILIDRQPILSVEELKAVPANMVDRIEIITNPSAKYRAQGRGSGVIEVYTRDFNLQGYNMTINANGGMNTQLKPTANLNTALSLKKKKLSMNFSVGGGFSQRYSFGSSQYQTTDGTDRMDVREWGRESMNAHPYLNLKAAYQIKEGHKISVGARGYGNQYNGNGTTLASYFQNGELVSDKVESSRDGYTWLNSSNFVNYIWETDTNGSSFEVNLNYRLKVDEGFAENFNEFQDAATGVFSDFDISNRTKNRPNIGESRIVYEHVFDTTGWKVSGGAVYNLVYNNKLFEQFNRENGEWVIDNAFSNSYEYVEQNGSFFTEINKKWDKISARVGLTAEYTDLDGYSYSLEQQFIDSNYLLLFPSASIMIEPNEKVGVTFSYSSGIDRPQFSNYDPFVRVQDSLSISYGNPYLRPEITHNFGISTDLFYAFNISVDYYVSDNPVSQLSFVDDQTFLVNSTPWNAQRNQAIGASAGLPIKSKWLNGWNSIWYNYNFYEFSPIFEREDFGFSTYGLWSYLNFILPSDITLTNRLYIGKWGSSESIGNVMANWSMRVTKKFMSNKFQIWGEVQDIVPPKNRFDEFAGNYRGTGSNQRAFTTLKLGLYYKFGRLKQDAHIRESKSGQSGRI